MATEVETRVQPASVPVSVSSIRIASSFAYLRNFAVVTGAGVLWTIVCELDAKGQKYAPAVRGSFQALSELAVQLPHVALLCIAEVATMISTIVLTRELQPCTTKQDSRCALCQPRSWAAATLPLLLFMVMGQLLFATFVVKPAPFLPPLFLSLATAQCLWLAPLWLYTSPHLKAEQQEDEPDNVVPMRKLQSAAALCLVVVAGGLVQLKYSYLLLHPQQTNELAYDAVLVYLSTIPAVCLFSVCCLYRDRRLIRKGSLQNDFTYYILLVYFQLFFPHYVYVGWKVWMFAIYDDCTQGFVVKLLVLVSYHLLFFLCQALVRLLSLFAVSGHRPAMLFILQFFEDFMADLIFVSVSPLSALFFINALVHTSKCLLRDCNGLRLCISWLHRRTVRASSRQLLLQEAEADVSFWGTLWQLYLGSFDLTVSRHQLFLTESCSKACIMTMIVVQCLMPMDDGHGVMMAVALSWKLRVLAGFALLWLFQLLTHVLVLRLLCRSDQSQVHEGTQCACLSGARTAGLPSQHAYINYWQRHTWFFVVQLLGPVFFVFAVTPLRYTECGAQNGDPP